MPLGTAEAQLAGTILSGSIALLGLALLLVGFWSQRWPKTKGIILVSIYDQEWQAETTSAGGNLEKKDTFHFAYSFVVAGQEYQSSNIKPNGDLEWSTSTPGLSSAADRSRWYREGKSVDVYYCPLWPKLCCLEPGGILLPIVLIIASGFIFLIAW